MSTPSAPGLEDRFYSGERPWRTLRALYRNHRGALALAAVFYVIKSAPQWAMPVITANVMEFRQRTRPSKRMFRYSGTERALDP